MNDTTYDDFKKVINDFYSSILIEGKNNFSTFNRTYKGILKGRYKNLGEMYNEILQEKKNKGVVYTPEYIAIYIIKNTIKEKSVIENPFLKICDPSCGTGNILIPTFKYLYNIYINNLEYINKKHNLNLNDSNVRVHILKNNIYGYDVDTIALKILIIELFLNSGIISTNFMEKDFLIGIKERKYDVFIGNPPYVGHKNVGRDYFQKVKEKFSDIYNSKADLSYCFIKEEIENLKEDGKLGVIISRYFIEAASADGFRKYLKDNSNLYKIVDYYGMRPFKNVGVDPAIIFLNKRSEQGKIQVIKAKEVNKEDILNILREEEKYCKKFFIEQKKLNLSPWTIVSYDEQKILDKIISKGTEVLEGIAKSYQGIITGCDKAFVVDEDCINKNNLERDIIKPWIKSSDINKGFINLPNKYLIYSNNIISEETYLNTIRHIGKYKNILERRRECLKGYRKWYELQWGRNKEVFQEKKIVFPYKSKNNRFSIDEGSFFSADVYALTLINDDEYSYSFLVNLLNSPIYEFYFKSFAKKLGGELYEYYPNTVMKLLIPKKEIHSYSYEELIKYYDITLEEEKIISTWIK